MDHRRHHSILVASMCLQLAACSDSGRRDSGVDATIADAATDAAAGETTVDAAPHVPTSFTPTAATRAYCGSRDDGAIEARITMLLGTLSLREKIALMSGTGLMLDGGGWRVPGNDAVGIPGLRMADGPRGLSNMLGRAATAFPVGMMRGATWDPALERRVGAAMADEFLSVGADVILAPTINILRHPRWGRAQETYSEDTHHLGSMGVAFIQGAQSRGVMASVKHYAANSIEDTRHTVSVQMDERTLREVYLPHFRRAVVEGQAASVMSAYNRVNGDWCDQSAHLLHDILRGEWGFAGFVESDWVLGTHGDAVSVRAGLDIEMPGPLHFARLPRAIALGQLTEYDVDDAVRRILRAQFCYGLETRTHPVDDATQRSTPEHLALAREVALRGTVLLRNETVRGAPALPFDSSVHSIVVLGRNADVENIGDHGSSDVLAGSVVTALEGIRARAGSGATVTLLPGTTLDAAAQAMVRAADAVVVVTGNQANDEGEADIGAGDRASLALHAEEVALIQSVSCWNDRVVVVLEGGATIITTGWGDQIEGLLFAFYPGAEGGTALADLLFGDASPAGRLPFSIPASEGDLPPFDGTSDRVTYEYLHGYRYLAAHGTAPTYPFGFGLSYTTFAYSGLTLSRTTVHAGDSVDAALTVTNQGSARGIETVQLYVAAVGSSVQRAPRDLRAFTQVDLAPGESRQVTLQLRVDDLSYWDVTTSRWVLEPVEYNVSVRPDSSATGVSATIRAM
ncbi:MAG: glycoside hydrolase family 3 N-terminal domain-containing protein [Deltaproteobacteria bacterium]